MKILALVTVTAVSVLLVVCTFPSELSEAQCRWRGFEICPVCGACVDLDDHACPACGATPTERLAAFVLEKHLARTPEPIQAPPVLNPVVKRTGRSSGPGGGIVVLPPTLERADPLVIPNASTWALVGARCHPGPTERCTNSSDRPDCRAGHARSFGCSGFKRTVVSAWAPRECVDVQPILLRALGADELAFRGIISRRVLLLCGRGLQNLRGLPRRGK